MEDPKTLTEWFAINPNHEVLLRPQPGGGVRAVLRGGESGLDLRLVGDGDDEAKAIDRALEVRAALREALP